MLARLNRLLTAYSTRLVLMAFGVQLVVLLLAMSYVWVSASREIAARDRALVVGLRDDLLAAWRVGGENELGAVIGARLSIQQEEYVVLLADGAGNALAGNLPGLPGGLMPGRGWQERNLVGPRIAGGAYLVLVTRLDDNHVLLAGRAASGSRSLAAAVGRAAATALLFTLPAALLLALWLGRLANARLAAVAAVAGSVADGDLTRRASRDGSGDAFDRLAGSLNAMLDRIELLVGELRILSDSLAHDLRSPLTRMRARLEAARANPAETEAALDIISAEMDRLLALLATALQISRAEAGVGREHLTRCDAHALLDDVAEIFGPAAEDAGVDLAVAEGAPLLVTLHRPLVQQALANLIDNALRHAHGASRIMLAATRAGDGVDLVVSDNGPGIPPDQRQTALSRYGRLDPARGSEEVGGAGMGLGLALVQAVARLHGGQLVLSDAAPGLKVVLHLPHQQQDVP